HDVGEDEPAAADQVAQVELHGVRVAKAYVLEEGGGGAHRVQAPQLPRLRPVGPDAEVLDLDFARIDYLQSGFEDAEKKVVFLSAAGRRPGPEPAIEGADAGEHIATHREVGADAPVMFRRRDPPLPVAYLRLEGRGEALSSQRFRSPDATAHHRHIQVV